MPVSARTRTIMAGLSACVLAGCSVFGMRDGTEQPSFDLVETPADGIEVRRYADRLVAETTVAGEAEGGANNAFRSLAGYIFGGNQDSREIAMTAPVEMAGPVSGTGRVIARTAPAEIGRVPDASMRMRFFLPADIAPETAPRPNDAAVTVTMVPSETYAVRRFSGLRSDSETHHQTRVLLQDLSETVWQPTGQPVAWFYDPPWTLPFLRRNEVAVPVRRRP